MAPLSHTKAPAPIGLLDAILFRIPTRLCSSTFLQQLRGRSADAEAALQAERRARRNALYFAAFSQPKLALTSCKFWRNQTYAKVMNVSVYYHTHVFLFSFIVISLAFQYHSCSHSSSKPKRSSLLFGGGGRGLTVNREVAEAAEECELGVAEGVVK